MCCEVPLRPSLDMDSLEGSKKVNVFSWKSRMLEWLLLHWFNWILPIYILLSVEAVFWNIKFIFRNSPIDFVCPSIHEWLGVIGKKWYIIQSDCFLFLFANIILSYKWEVCFTKTSKNLRHPSCSFHFVVNNILGISEFEVVQSWRLNKYLAYHCVSNCSVASI